MSATAVQFVLLALIWGSSFLFMKVALTGVSFGQIAWSRAILGALVLGIVMIVARQRLPREPVVWAHFVVIAVTNCVIPHLAFAWAEQHVSSSIASIYNSFTPIATAVLAALVYKVEKLTGRRIVGVLLGIVGVIVIIAPWNIGALTGDVQGQLACLLAAISYGVAIGYIRRFISHREISGITVAFMNIGMAAAIMLVLTPLLAVGEVQLDFWVVGSLLLLGGLGTGLAYIWNIGIIRAWGPTMSSTVTYLIPVVGVLLGVIVLHERLSWHEPLGAVIVLAGILVTQGQLRVRRARTKPLESAAEGQRAEGP
ncbi:DMT family transporter [Salinibacterium hongtaonis]|uniref:EamA family transporter n=1 Tax=Homoserinimonas hongtaonis TaxID=2079791 RepID=A0A2U1T1A9_9MICO|nr:DMT family transporter [Salinibacterium hongtaonis]PWB97645.1 EamA family transporter [Salinibacterium hongtaonis]